MGPVDIFNEKQRGGYNQMIADSLDVTLSKKQRQMKKDTAALKMKTAVSKRKEEFDDPDAKATNDKQREKRRVWHSLHDADAKRKRNAGDEKALAAYAIKLEQYSTRYASNKVARLAGDEKALAVYDIHLEKASILHASNKVARLAGDPKALAAYAIQLEKVSIRDEANRQALHDELAATWAKTGETSKSTEFGLGDESRENEIDARVNDLMDSPAGSLCPN
ncbi:hypothetical protein T484DRAFT_1758335, partial [Baffinella frigidus]